MLSKSKIQYIQSLKIKKYRDRHQAFIVEGEKMAFDILTSKSIEIENIIALEKWVLDNIKILQPFINSVLTVSEAELKQVSSLTTPNKVILICKIPPPPIVSTQAQLGDDFIDKNLTLYLDGIQDPGNMGTILRIADWFSIPYVLCSKTCVDVYNPKVVQASMSALLRVKTAEVDFEDIKKQHPTLNVMATTMSGVSIFEGGLPKTGLLVIGNEGSGVSDAILRQADYLISIPGSGEAESLNAAVATGIICAVMRHFK